MLGYRKGGAFIWGLCGNSQRRSAQWLRCAYSRKTGIACLPYLSSGGNGVCVVETIFILGPWRRWGGVVIGAGSGRLSIRDIVFTAGSSGASHDDEGEA